MNNSIKYIFIAGLCILSVGWAFFVQKTSSEVQVSRSSSFELRSNLIETRWNQIVNREVKFGLGEGPQVFNLELSGLDKAIKGSEFAQSYRGMSTSKIKAAYIDAGADSSFFTTQINGETFFVKVQKTSQSVMLQGFTYTYVLNLLNAGLSGSEWYFVDSKNRVVFSHKASYLGKSKSFKAAFSKRFDVGGKKYSLQMVDPEPYSAASVLWLGLVGFLLLGFANFPSFSGMGTIGIADYSGKNRESDVIVKKEDAIESAKSKEEEEPKLQEEERGLVERRYKALDEGDVSIEPLRNEIEVVEEQQSKTDLDDVEDFKALELNSGSDVSFVSNDDEGYSEFLTENPSLTMKMPAIPNKKIIEPAIDAKSKTAPVMKEQKAKVEEGEEGIISVAPPAPETLSDVVLMDEEAAAPADENRSGSDWIKLAEELSANLEKFAGEWKEKDSSVSKKSIESEA